MEIQVPLKNLRFGQDAGGINARVTGRTDGIDALAANIFAQSRTEKLESRKGLIENLIVKPLQGGLFGVSNGNRRLAALQMIHGADSDEEIPCTPHDVDDADAFEHSLTTAVIAAQLHPVDQYEAFAKLKERNNTEDEIAQRFGMSVRQVEQAMALGQLSPTIRQAWRNNEIKAEAAHAFTMVDHARQDNALEEMGKRYADLRYADAGDVKNVLDIARGGAGALVEFVGIDAYVARGGSVTRDLFGTDHQVADEKLAQEMAAERIARECEALVAAGWSFAIPFASVSKIHHSYGYLSRNDAATDDEVARLQTLNVIFDDPDDDYGQREFGSMSVVEQEAFLAHRQLKMDIAARSYTAKDKKKGGCFVDISDDGHLDITFGRIKPAEPKAAAAADKAIARAAEKVTPGASGSSAAAAAPEPTVISNALRDRLISQLTHGTRDAVMAAIDTDLIKSPLAQTLAKIVVSQINADQPHRTPHSVMTKMHAIRESIPATMINNTILMRFDAADYFGSAPKSFVLKAIVEAINADEARKVAKKTKAEIGKFAIANVGNKLGWVPKEMRTPAYVGPKPAPAAAKAKAAPAKKAVAKAAAKAKAATKKKTAKKKA